MRKINIEDLKRDVLGLFKRFPLALAFLAMLTIWSLLNIWDKVYVTGTYRMHDHTTGWFTINEIQQGTIFYYMSIAIVLSICLRAKKRKRLGLYMTSIALPFTAFRTSHLVKNGMTV